MPSEQQIKQWLDEEKLITKVSAEVDEHLKPQTNVRLNMELIQDMRMRHGRSETAKWIGVTIMDCIMGLPEPIDRSEIVAS